MSEIWEDVCTAFEVVYRGSADDIDVNHPALVKANAFDSETGTLIQWSAGDVLRAVNHKDCINVYLVSKVICDPKSRGKPVWGCTSQSTDAFLSKDIVTVADVAVDDARVFAHEIGHALGLDHFGKPGDWEIEKDNTAPNLAGTELAKTQNLMDDKYHVTPGGLPVPVTLRDFQIKTAAGSLAKDACARYYLPK